MEPEPPRAYLGRVVLDTIDMDRALAFWSAALGYVLRHRDATFAVLKDPRGRRMSLGFQPADAPKTTTSPLHVEVFTDDMEREARRLETLGASRVADWPYPDEDHNWIVLRDPVDGHEICVCEFPAEGLDL